MLLKVAVGLAAVYVLFLIILMASGNFETVPIWLSMVVLPVAIAGVAGIGYMKR